MTGAGLSLYATAGSQATFDFSALAIHTEGGKLRGVMTERGLPGADG